MLNFAIFDQTLAAVKTNIEEFLPRDSDGTVFWQEVAMTEEYAPLMKALSLIEINQ
jgi:hypothetical protein